MSREQNYTAVILKKQPFGEADEIVTLYTQELGKLRVLAKSSKAAASKLQHALQSLFLIDARVAGSKDFPKIIGAEIKNSFPGIRQNLTAAKYAFYGVELVLKFSPDEQKNQSLFELLKDFLSFLDTALDNAELLGRGLLKFKICFLDVMGLSLPQEQVVKETDRSIFVELGNLPFFKLSKLEVKSGELGNLQRQLSDFIRYELEREVKSEGFLDL